MRSTIPTKSPSSRACSGAMLALAIAVLGCGGGTTEEATEGMPPPPPGTSSDETSSSTSGEGSTGSSSTGEPGSGPCGGECPDEQHCVGVAVVGQMAPPSEGVCISGCIAAGDVGSWCFDDASCCGGQCDLQYGLCRDSGATSSTGSESGDDTSSSGTTEDTSTSSSTTDASSSSGDASSSSSTG